MSGDSMQKSDASNSMLGGKHSRYHYTGKQYWYRGSLRIQKNNTILKNSINTSFKFFITIKKRIIVELTSRQADMQASVHPSEAKQAGAQLTYNTKRHQVRCGYYSRHS